MRSLGEDIGTADLLAHNQDVVGTFLRCKLLALKEVVGANGFEPSTSWSRTRFRSLLKSMKFCDSEEIENNAVAARLLILFETRSCEVLPQLQNHLHCPRCLRWSGLFFLKLPYAFNFFGAVHLGGTGRRRKGEHVG